MARGHGTGLRRWDLCLLGTGRCTGSREPRTRSEAARHRPCSPRRSRGPRRRPRTHVGSRASRRLPRWRLRPARRRSCPSVGAEAACRRPRPAPEDGPARRPPAPPLAAVMGLARQGWPRRSWRTRRGPAPARPEDGCRRAGLEDNGEGKSGRNGRTPTTNPGTKKKKKKPGQQGDGY
jgi:hypothetical protein